MRSPICFVSAAPETTVLFKQSLSHLPDAPLIVGGTLSTSESAARAALEQGSEILVATEHNARNLRRKLNATVVAIPVTVLDIAEAVYIAKAQFGHPVALLRFHFHDARLAALQQIMNCEIKEFVFRDELECRAELRRAEEEGCRAAVIGGPIPKQTSRNEHIPCVPLLPAPADIMLAFQQAKQLAYVRQIERRDAMRSKYVVQYSFNAVIVTDEQDKIVVFNPAAERMFDIPAERALGLTIKEAIPQSQLLVGGETKAAQLEEVKFIGQKHVMVNSIPILEDKQVFGIIYTLQEVHKIQSMDEKIRRASRSDGLVAKLTFRNIVGESRAIKDAISRAQRFAATDETILITGESGTGKEIFAQSIHNQSSRRTQPFVAINCAAIPATLLDSELFGYAEGAFTGARRGGKQGVFELAHLGTIFLDEVGQLPHAAQSHLLRVLQEKEVMRVGDGKVTPLNVRVIAATNQPLEEAVGCGLFRTDLYYRLNVLQLRLPPLREHPEDVLLLIRCLIDERCVNQELADQLKTILQKYESILTRYPWPGNVREVQNLVKRVIALVKTVTGDTVEQEIRDLLDETFNNTIVSALLTKSRVPGNLKEALTNLESELIWQQHQESGGSKVELARKLGINRSTLWRKLKRDEFKLRKTLPDSV